MSIGIDIAILANVLLVFIRLGVLFLVSPIMLATGMPVRIRLLLTLALAYLIVAIDMDATLMTFYSWYQWLFAAVSEAFVGALMAFGLFASFGAFLLGGRILDFQMGFGVANLIDPSTNFSSPLLGTVLNFIAVAVFYALDGHLVLLKSIDYSLMLIPPGTLIRGFDIAPLVKQFGLMFTFGLILVAPAVFSLFLVDVAMAVAARTMPQVNMFILSLPLKIGLGLLVLTLSLVYMKGVFQEIFNEMFIYIDTVIS